MVQMSRVKKGVLGRYLLNGKPVSAARANHIAQNPKSQESNGRQTSGSFYRGRPASVTVCLRLTSSPRQTRDRISNTFIMLDLLILHPALMHA